MSHRLNTEKINKLCFQPAKVNHLPQRPQNYDQIAVITATHATHATLAARLDMISTSKIAIEFASLAHSFHIFRF